MLLFSVTIFEKICFFNINFGLLSSQTTKIELVCMYFDVSDPRSPILMVPGPENGLKCPKNCFLSKILKFFGWVGGMSRRR